MESKTCDDLSSWHMINFKDLKLGDRIGGGGVGVVYNGFWKGEPVAIKVCVIFVLIIRVLMLRTGTF